MKLGVGLPSYASDPHRIPPNRLRRYAQQAEEREFAGAWLIEHLVRPPTYATSLLDPLTTLAHVAGATETLPLGTSVLLLPLRDVVMVAKRAATIQHLAGDRLTLGLGTGYVEEEFDAVGVPIEERSARFLEGIELLRALFAGERVTFAGDYFSVSDFQLEPVTDPPPRILTGGGGTDRPTKDGSGTERVVLDSVKRRIDAADGWIAPPRAPDVLETDWTAFASRLDSQGRDPDSVDRVALQYLHLEPGDPEQARRHQRREAADFIGPDRTVDEIEDAWLFGSVDDIKERLRRYERQGFDQV
ncbi:MAG: LLM class flavin-dependent oxidoreductase, partial [Halobacteriales archaeon]|nr:LLM class flavin-dependent oxidoreductase [Halobacteriales archaeon]